MKQFWVVFFIALILLIPGCVKQLEKMLPSGTRDFAETFIEKMLIKDVNYVLAHSESKLQEDVSNGLLEKLAAELPKGDVVKNEFSGINIHHVSKLSDSAYTNIIISFQYEFTDGWALVTLNLIQRTDSTKVIGFTAKKLNASLQDLNRFSFTGKSPIHFFMLFAAISSLLFVVVSFITCIRTPIQGRKWLWVLMTLACVGKLSINWTTGQLGYQMMNISLLAMSASTTEYAPWILSIHLPIGSIFFWIKRKDLIKKSKVIDPETIVPPPLPEPES